MGRRFVSIGAAVLALTIPSTLNAYFPPEIGLTPPVVLGPPAPFGIPNTGGLGDPVAPEPGPGPTVQTPEPASLVTALTGMAAAGLYAWRRRKVGSPTSAFSS